MRLFYFNKIIRKKTFSGAKTSLLLKILIILEKLLMLISILKILKLISIKRNMCSRKNLVFLFGALIDLTVRVNAYFHPIIPDHFSGQHQIGEKPAKHSLPQKLSNWADVITVRSTFSSSITTPWGKPSNLWTPYIYSLRPRVPSWIWIRWIQFTSHRNNSKSPSTLAMSTATQNTALTTSHFIPGQHFPETFTLLCPNDQDHAFMGDYIIPVLSQQTWLLLHYGNHISLTHSTMP